MIKHIKLISTFLPGYLDNLFKTGKRPTYGYPNTPVYPTTKESTMKVQTCYRPIIKGK